MGPKVHFSPGPNSDSATHGLLWKGTTTLLMVTTTREEIPWHTVSSLHDACTFPDLVYVQSSADGRRIQRLLDRWGKHPWFALVISLWSFREWSLNSISWNLVSSKDTLQSGSGIPRMCFAQAIGDFKQAPFSVVGFALNPWTHGEPEGTLKTTWSHPLLLLIRKLRSRDTHQFTVLIRDRS